MAKKKNDRSLDYEVLNKILICIDSIRNHQINRVGQIDSLITDAMEMLGSVFERMRMQLTRKKLVLKNMIPNDVEIEFKIGETNIPYTQRIKLLSDMATQISDESDQILKMMQVDDLVKQILEQVYREDDLIKSSLLRLHNEIDDSLTKEGKMGDSIAEIESILRDLETKGVSAEERAKVKQSSLKTGDIDLF